MSGCENIWLYITLNKSDYGYHANTEFEKSSLCLICAQTIKIFEFAYHIVHCARINQLTPNSSDIN